MLGPIKLLINVCWERGELKKSLGLVGDFRVDRDQTQASNVFFRAPWMESVPRKRGNGWIQRTDVELGDAGRVCINTFIREFEEDLSDVE